MIVDISNFELHNIVKFPFGLRTRRGLTSLKTPSSLHKFCGAFTIESPFTTEPWHYLFEQHNSTRVITLRCFTEEYIEMWSLSLGAIQRNPVITYGVVNNQIMINSPSFPAPLYGVVGGGVITAVKTESTISTQTTLNIPSGHICAWVDRFPIAQGTIVYFNDPGNDPRTYIANNTVVLRGTIYDQFQGPDGALYLATSVGMFAIAADAAGQGQEVTGFVSQIPGVETTRPRNACASKGAVAVLQKDHIALVDSSGVKGRIDLDRQPGRRYTATDVYVDDLRRAGEIFPTPDGFVVSFRSHRGFWLEVNLENKSASYTSNGSAVFNLVGTLRTREGEVLYVTTNNVLQAFTEGPLDDLNSSEIVGVARGAVKMPNNERPVTRRVTIGADNIGKTQLANVDATSKSGTTPTKTGDVIVGTTTWASTGTMAGRSIRRVRHSFDVRASEPGLEVVVRDGARRIESAVDVEVNGQGRKRREAN